jgi:hypothetical protein
MKTRSGFAAVFFVLAFVQTAPGQGSERVTIQYYVGGDIVKVIYKSMAPGNVGVTIMNDRHQAIFAETIPNTASFARPYNLSELTTGKYFIVVEDKEGKTEKELTYAIRKKVESTIDVIKIANAHNKFLLSVENKEADQIQVRILDQDKNVIHEELLSVNGKFAIVYNLSRITGTVTFEVGGTSGNWKTFTY